MHGVETKIKGLFDEINAHPGKRILDVLQKYESAKSVFAGNAMQLRQLILLMEDVTDPLNISSWPERPKLQGMFGEIFRLFHNFLTSAQTLVEHTRNTHKSDFITAEHIAEHQAHVEAMFVGDELFSFVLSFRDYVLHHSVPNIQLTDHLFPAARRLELEIAVTKMFQWEGWKAPARKYLGRNQPNLRILKVVDECEGKQRKFYEASVGRFHKYYAVELADVMKLLGVWNRSFPTWAGT